MEAPAWRAAGTSITSIAAARASHFRRLHEIIGTGGSIAELRNSPHETGTHSGGSCFLRFVSLPRVQIVRDIRGRIGYRVRQLNNKTFRIIKRRPVVAEHSAQFVIVQACFSAHGRIHIYSERTTNPGRRADFSKLNVAQRDKPFAAESRFHRDAAPDESGQAHLDLYRRKIFPEHFPYDAVKPS